MLFLSSLAGCVTATGLLGGGVDDPAADDAATDDTDLPDAGGADSGGGSPDTKVADTGATSPDTTPADTGTAPADTAPADTGDGWSAAWAALEDEILVETNKRRAAGADCHSAGVFPPAPPLVMHPKLRTSARLHSKDMADKNYFSHTGLDGTSPFDRMKAAGYSGSTMGENIAAGNGTAAATMVQWMNSDGHCSNIMKASYTHLGVGYAFGASSTYKHYWTQNFGAGG